MTQHRSTVELQSAPALGPLFARAILSRQTRRAGTALQDSRLSLVAQPIGAAHLRRYQLVCGFRVSDVLPATYLHVLAFPLSMARMTQADFPFPLLGLVHVRNVISQVRPVRLDESVSVAVWAENVRPHHAGQQVDLVSEARVAGEIVWSETSTYLRRSHSTSSGGKAAEKPAAGTTMPPGATAQWRMPADIGRRYAAVSGDRNPIHLHDLTAKAFGFRKAIGHGMWLKARTLAAFEGRLADAFTVDVSFKTPVFLPATVEMSSTRHEGRWSFEVHDAGSRKPHLIGEISDTQFPSNG